MLSRKLGAARVENFEEQVGESQLLLQTPEHKRVQLVSSVRWSPRLRFYRTL